MKKVYIASPYTIGDQEENVKFQMRVGALLMDHGFAPFIPLLYHYQDKLHPRPYDKWLEIDFAWILSCDCLLRLGGESKGADMEVEFAKENNIPVYYSVEEVVKNES